MVTIGRIVFVLWILTIIGWSFNVQYLNYHHDQEINQLIHQYQKILQGRDYGNGKMSNTSTERR
jgi:hypothetical protein